MDARKLILLVGALVVAAITAFMARSLVLGTPTRTAGAIPTAAAPLNTTEVMVATRALPVGTILDATAFKYVAWPKELVDGAYYIKGESEPAKLQGTVVRFAIPAGQPITQGALVNPGDRGFLAAALGAGMRAVTVPVSSQGANVSGFVFPGDRIDLMLTQSVAGGGDGPPLNASETILRNLRVLATDQKTDKQTDDKGNTVVTTFSTVTVEATPKIAEQIAVAQKVGELSLSLRSIADNQGELEEAIANGDVDVPADGDPKKEKEMLARAAARPTQSRGGFSTGADVSRFQRSTVPGRAEEPKPASQVATPAPGGAEKSKGPVVTVARGNSVTEVEVGGRN